MVACKALPSVLYATLSTGYPVIILLGKINAAVTSYQVLYIQHITCCEGGGVDEARHLGVDGRQAEEAKNTNCCEAARDERKKVGVGVGSGGQSTHANKELATQASKQGRSRCCQRIQTPVNVGQIIYYSAFFIVTLM